MSDFLFFSRIRCLLVGIMLPVLLMAIPVSAFGNASDSLRRVGWGVYFSPSRQIAMDQYERKWLNGKSQLSMGAELDFCSLPADSDAFAADYGHPLLTMGAELSLNNNVTMRKQPDAAWGQLQTVDYDSRLGDILSLYLAFHRPLLRTPQWELDYHMKAGAGYNPLCYNRHDNIDNELIGSHFTIFFGAGVRATYRVARNWGLSASVEYGHHSNGALDRPNKGENHIGPMIGLRYYPYYESLLAETTFRPSFKPYWYANVTAGIGAKSLLEEWQLTQFQTAPSSPDYRTGHFRLYAAWSAQADVMYRYARRWASGIGADVFYGTYYHRVAAIETAQGHDVRHSPWSVGVAAKHEVFYHRLSLAMSLGVYLFREMGVSAKEIETPYYERIGIHYSFPQWGNIKIGANVKAHRTKADLTELVVSVPFRLH